MKDVRTHLAKDFDEDTIAEHKAYIKEVVKDNLPQ